MVKRRREREIFWCFQLTTIITYYDDPLWLWVNDIFLLSFPENNEFGEVKPTPVLKNNHQGKQENLHIISSKTKQTFFHPDIIEFKIPFDIVKLPAFSCCFNAIFKSI